MRNKIFISIFIFSVLIGSFFYFNSYKERKIEEKLHHFSSQEREYLDNFFQYLIRISGFGYVLFGDKPMGIEFVDYSIPSKSVEGFDYMDDQHIVYKYRFKEGWETWEKYKNLFPSKNFIFFDYPHSWNNDYRVICLINKSTFLNVIRENIEDFHLALGNTMSPEQILENYTHQGEIFKIINNHDGLFGTLLGYGRENAWAFKEQIEMENPLMTFFDKENIETEKFITLPGFLAFPNTQETLNLDRKYNEQRKEIEKKFSNKKFLLPTIKKLLY